MSDQEFESDRLGVECVIGGCDTRLVSLRDGWPSSTRDGPVCADCWDHNSEHGHFPDEDSVRDVLTDGGDRSDGGVDRKVYHDVTTGEWVEVEAGNEKSRRWMAAQKLGCDKSDIRRGYDHSDREPDETPVADGVLRDALDDDLVTDGGPAQLRDDDSGMWRAEE